MISFPIASRPASRPTGAEIFARSRLKSAATTATAGRFGREPSALSFREHPGRIAHFVKLAALTAAFMTIGYVVLWKPVLDRWVF